jgi:transposase
MGRRSNLSEEVVEAAREVVRRTKDAAELRKAMSVVLSGRLGISLAGVGVLIGRSRATVARFRGEFKAWCAGLKTTKKQWGGRRRSYLTFEEEKEFLGGFFEAATRGNIVVVGEVHEALEEKLGHKVAETTVYRMLARHGWRKIAPRPRHPKASEAAQAEFKKNFKKK